MKTRHLFMCLALAIAPAWAQDRKPPKTVDKRFITLAAADLAGNLIDVATSQHCRAVNPTCYETNPLLGRNPGWGRQTATLLAFSAANTYLAYRLKKSPTLHRFWYIPFALSFAGSVRGIQSNVRATSTYRTATLPMEVIK